MKILIVEDEALVAMNMQDVLEAQGHQVIKIADDEESAILAAMSVVKTFGTTRGVGLRSAGLVWV